MFVFLLFVSVVDIWFEIYGRLLYMISILWCAVWQWRLTEDYHYGQWSVKALMFQMLNHKGQWESELLTETPLPDGVVFYCEGPSPWLWPEARDSHDTCPTPVHMLTCIWSAVAAWQHSLCVCTEIAMCEFVHYMQVCACVCHQSVSPRQQHHMHAPVTVQTCRPRQHLSTHSSSCTILHIVLSAACHSAWRLCSMSTFLL